MGDLRCKGCSNGERTCIRWRWGRIAVELARRAACLNSGDFEFDFGDGRTENRQFESIRNLCKGPPDNHHGWLWVYAPLLVNLLGRTKSGKPPIAGIATIGHYHYPAPGDLQQQWLNCVAEDVEGDELKAYWFLASLLQAKLPADNGKATPFAQEVILTRDLVERYNASEPCRGGLKHAQHALEPVGLFFRPKEHFDPKLAGYFGRVKGQRVLSLEHYAWLPQPHEEKFSSLVDDDAKRSEFEKQLAAYLSALRTKARKTLDPGDPGELSKALPRTKKTEMMLKQGLIWLNDICAAVGAECVMSIPAWLPPRPNGTQTGVLIVYPRVNFPWQHHHDIVSAYHSGGLMYLGKSERQRILQLEKYQQMISVAFEPLNNIANALAELQHDAQEVRAVIYDPGTAILQSHFQLAALFKDREEHDICNNKSLRVVLSHWPESYSLAHHPREDTRESIRMSRLAGQCVLAEALLAFFGRRGDIEKCGTYSQAIKTARQTLGDVASRPETKDLAKDIVWLCSKGAKRDAAILPLLLNARPAVSSLGEGEGEAPVDPLHVALGQLKNCIHYPFKVEHPKWEGWPFLLCLHRFLPRDDQFSLAGGKGIAGANNNVALHPSNTPATCSGIIRFVLGVCIAQMEKAGLRPLKRFVFEGDELQQVKMVLAFNFWHVEEPTAQRLVRDLRRVVGLPRDWRIREASQGNFSEPFVTLAHGLLGVVRREASGNGWINKPAGGGKGFSKVLRLTKGDREFCVEVLIGEADPGEKEHIRITWSAMKK